MARVGGTVLTILTLVIFALLFFQWNSYEKTSGDRKRSMSQQITIKHSGNEILVTQVFQPLEEDSYQLNIPTGIENVKCQNDDCPKKLKPMNNQIQITYNIEQDDRNHAFLLNEFISIDNVLTEHTSMEIIESSKERGTWSSNMNLVSKDSMELIDYYLFENDGEATDLYWQKNPLIRSVTKEGFILYKSEPLKASRLLPNIDYQFSQMPAIIFSDFMKNQQTESLIFVSNGEEEQLKSEILVSLIWAEFIPNEENGHIVAEVIAAFIENREPTLNHAKTMFHELKNQLTDEKRNQFLKHLFNQQHQNIRNVNTFDIILGDVAGGKTDFFKKNISTGSFHPLLFVKEKDLYVRNQHLEHSLLYFDGQSRYYPFQTIMESLGYEYKILHENEVYVKNDIETYRFYFDKTYFILNEDEYGLYENPFKRIGESIFIREEWLARLFKVQVFESEKKIEVF